MADHLSEEEQIEALKNWWSQYWASVVLPIVVAAVAYFGWTSYETMQQKKAEAGSVAYQELVQKLEVTPGTALTEEQRATGKVLAAGIIKDFAGSLYADHANFILARIAVDENDLDKAESALAQVVQNGSNEAMQALATSRLARVKISKGQADAALDLVSSSDAGEYASVFAEVRGDAYAAQGKTEEAKTAYQEAIDKLLPAQMSRQSIIQLKLDGASLLVAKADAPAAEEAPTADESADEASSENAAETADAPETADVSTENP